MNVITADIRESKQMTEQLENLDYTKKKVLEYELKYREEMLTVLKNHTSGEWTKELDECLWLVEMHSIMTMKDIAEKQEMSTRQVSNYIRKGLGIIINFLDTIANDLEDKKNVKAYIYFRSALNACPVKAAKRK